MKLTPAIADKPADSGVAAQSAFHDTLRRLLHASVGFLVLFLVVRTLVLEPFGVPTGSMALTFLGNHREGSCPRCGFAVVVGEPGDRERQTFQDLTCPNCGQRKVDLSGAIVLPGDRLLVDKNVFQLRRPRRWEVCVFRCPDDDSKPYVKRVVGLPGESIQLRGGDVYADGELLRKTLRQSRECRVLAFDHARAPAGGWGQRWIVQELAENAVPGPASPKILQDSTIVLDATTPQSPALGLTLRNWNLDIRAEEPFTDWIGYNGTRRGNGQQTVHDFIVTFDLDVRAGSGSFACRLNDGLDSVFVDFPIHTEDGTRLGRDGAEPAMQTGLKLEVGQSYRIEFAFVDRRATLAVDGTAIPPALDLPADNLGARKGVARPVQFGIRGASVAIRNFQLYRDVHLREDGSHGGRSPHALRNDEYFVVGDNSANSHDSREWHSPGVPERYFLGKPFLIHQPLTIAPGGGYQTIDWDRFRWVR